MDLRDTRLGEKRLTEALAETWSTPPGLIGWISSVDHKAIAKRYFVAAFAFLILGGLAAVAMRAQLAQPENELVGPDLYNQLFTMHGTTMMFLFAVPIMEAVGIYFVPLMVGTRNIAFPRLTAFSFWVYLFGGCVLWIAFIFNRGADAGWFSYVPLASLEFNPTKRADIWAQMVTYTELSALAVAVSLICTVLKQRAPGMILDRIPIFVWAELVTAFVVLFAMPAVMLASTMLILDRLVDTDFFNVSAGGNVLLWQHLFWFFGHPEVYSIFIPATGMVSAIIPTFVRRPMLGYWPIVLSLIATGSLSFVLWGHHMFAAGLAHGGRMFEAISMMIAIPSGIQIFCWIATIWTGSIRFATPMLFVIGFFFLFVLGGLTGVMVASMPLDSQVHDTYFVVAHFHYVLIGGSVFPLIGATYYWFPKITGRMMSERLGRWNFWLAFIGFNIAFFPMHLLGFWGMPRRVYTYSLEMGWGDLNLLSTIGALMLFSSFALFFLNIILSARSGTPAGDNPWDAGTLEWATPSPPPAYNFALIPVVSHREPLWAERNEMPVVRGMHVDRREVIVSTVRDAEPDLAETSPDSSVWPFLAAIVVGLTLLGSVFTPWAVVWGAVPIAVTLIGWFWPKGGKEEEE